MTPWVNWKSLAKPNMPGGWGLKNIFLFSKSLAAKLIWRFLKTNSPWTDIITHKYTHPNSIEYWVRSFDKKINNGYIIWKEVVQCFLVVGEGLAWLIGNGSKVRLGEDLWPGSRQNHILPFDIIQALQIQGYFTLDQVTDTWEFSFWRQ
jgi:hypothetical protein